MKFTPSEIKFMNAFFDPEYVVEFLAFAESKSKEHEETKKSSFVPGPGEESCEHDTKTRDENGDFKRCSKKKAKDSKYCPQHKRMVEAKATEEVPEETKQTLTNEECFIILGMEPTESYEDVKKVYHELALKYHPDKNSELSDDEKKKVSDKFVRIKEASKILKARLK